MKRNEMSRACSMHRRDGKHNILVEKHGGKRSFGGPKCRWNDTIRSVVRNRDDDDWVNILFRIGFSGRNM
jgi:hypothetical protein